MTELNLPPANLNIKQENGKTQVFDILRKRFVTLTPEEWVRQHFVHFLIHTKQYPQGRIGNEISLKVNDMNKRCDTVIYGADAQPIAIIEYKAPTVVITQKVFDQIWRYNLPLHVPYLIISNGLHHFCCKMDGEKVCFLQEIPLFSELESNGQDKKK